MRSSTLKTTISVVTIVLLLISLQVAARTDNNLWEREPQQESQSDSQSQSPSASGSGTTSTPSSTGKSSSITPAPTSSDPYGPTIKNTTSSSGTNKPSGTASGGNSTSTPTSTSNSTLPVASIVPPQPVQISVTEPANEKNILCKIGSNITFAWKYLNSFGPNLTPKEINVQAQSFLDTNKYYDICLNCSGDTTKVTWDSSTDLPVATYKLFIYDERGMTAVPQNGRLSPYSGLQFKMYSPKPVVPLEDYQCPTCYNTASPSIPYIPLLITFSISLITITLFTSGL